LLMYGFSLSMILAAAANIQKLFLCITISSDGSSAQFQFLSSNEESLSY
jgi:hypothetical protein